MELQWYLLLRWMRVSEGSNLQQKQYATVTADVLCCRLQRCSKQLL
jgi:hypothetical protein